jgi:hypothetical protein
MAPISQPELSGHWAAAEKRAWIAVGAQRYLTTLHTDEQFPMPFPRLDSPASVWHCSHLTMRPVLRPHGGTVADGEIAERWG